MRYLVPASDVHARLDQVEIPGLRQKPAAAHTAITETQVRPAKGIQRTWESNPSRVNAWHVSSVLAYHLPRSPLAPG